MADTVCNQRVAYYLPSDRSNSHSALPCRIRSLIIAFLHCFADRYFSVGVFLQLYTGHGALQFGLPVAALSGVCAACTRRLEIGKTMVVMGAAQLAIAPFAAMAEKKVNPILLTAIGYAPFCLPVSSSATASCNLQKTDFDGLFLASDPAWKRHAAVLILPTTAARP